MTVIKRAKPHQDVLHLPKSLNQIVIYMKADLTLLEMERPG